MGFATCFPKLFEPGTLGGVRIRNRIVMQPMGGYFPGPSGEISDRSKAYFVERAKGGVGLIIVGLTGVMPRDQSITKNYSTLAESTLLPSHYHLTEAVHLNGARIGVQLCHIGSAMTIEDWGGKPPLSPSGVPQLKVDGTPYCVPLPMSRGEIHELIEYFGTAGKNARRAGYDLVEVHAGHGYLLNAFLSPATNRRTDDFGGSVERRARIVVEILREIHRVAGSDFPVGVRISADEFIPGGITLEDSPVTSKVLEQAGAAYINVSVGTSATSYFTSDAMRLEEGWKQYIWTAIKQAIDIPTISGGGLRTAQFCEALLSERKTDFVGLARPMLADAYWPVKAREGRISEICPCISCLRCLYAPGGGRPVVRHCTVNATWGRELEYADTSPAPAKKNVVIIGGGVAGMEAARVASLRGHRVTLYEKGEELGGQVLLSRDIPGKKKLQIFVDYLASQVKKQGVTVRLGTEATPDLIAAAEPDEVVVATGSSQLVPRIPGIGSSNVILAWDVLQGNPKLAGEEVLVIGGGIVGCETAEFLASNGNKVTIVEMLPKMALDMEPVNRRSLLDALNELKVTMLAGNKVAGVDDEGVEIEDATTGERQRIRVSHVVLAAGSVPSRGLADELEAIGARVHLAGDCEKVRTILDAVGDGFLIGNLI